MNKTLTLLLVGTTTLGLSLAFLPNTSVTAQPATAEVIVPEHDYVGVAKCTKVCHNLDAKPKRGRGNQLEQWSASGHANAYHVLASKEAEEIAVLIGIEDPQTSADCLRCHTTAYGVPTEYLGSKFDMTQGVQCETCHGPGKDYKRMKTMRDREKAVAAGLLIPTEETCLQCHNEESPTYKEFNFEERWEQVQHKLDT